MEIDKEQEQVGRESKKSVPSSQEEEEAIKKTNGGIKPEELSSGMEIDKEQEQVEEQESEKSMPSSQEEEEAIKKKYGGIKPEELSSGMEIDKEQEQVEGQESEKSMPSSQEEEEAIKKKYGGIKPKKPPLISKDHERAYFDSADWALGKQGVNKPKGPLEALRPKLQPTQQQTRYRKSPCAPSDGEDGGSAQMEDGTANE